MKLSEVADFTTNTLQAVEGFKFTLRMIWLVYERNIGG